MFHFEEAGIVTAEGDNKYDYDSTEDRKYQQPFWEG
jgi:hypothetical protein